MQMRLLITILLFSCTLDFVIGQYSLSGTVQNEKGEKLAFATVFFENTGFAAATDDRGHYIIHNIPPGRYDFKVAYIGYESITQSIMMDDTKIMDVTMNGEIYNIDVIEILSNRVRENDPFTKSNLNKNQLQKENLGQDVPFLLQWSPSMVVSSDAGSGIGYTNLRMRGSDQTRINVTINGVPLNDAESHNVFWVDLPDLMGSVNNIQLQRGVGTSTNGSGAFGGAVSISTSDTRINPFFDLSGSLGSFNSQKLSMHAGTGLINRKFIADAKYAVVKSDGYIDRASADLQSLYFSAGRITDRSSLKINILSGRETTYQAWYGVPESKLMDNTQALIQHYNNNYGSIYKSSSDSINLFNSDRRYNYYTYPNQVDNYRQTHLQLIHALAVNPKSKIKTTLFYTRGKGYFEEFKYNEKFEKYRLPVIQSAAGDIFSADLVRRRWLDNHFLGFNADVTIQTNGKWTWQSGLSSSFYLGNHYGNIAKITIQHPDWDPRNNYYENMGEKYESSLFIRVLHDLNEKVSWHGDIQVRNLNYSISGTDNDLRSLKTDYHDFFVNPKLGMNYLISKSANVYASYAVAHKEPSRGDFVDHVKQISPKSEMLQNTEIGFRAQSSFLKLESNIYYMHYSNELVLTGEINDVGAPIRINVPKSYRLGFETEFQAKLRKKWFFNFNINLSKNKISAFDEVVADYTVDFEKTSIHHKNTDISFSPSCVASLQLMFKPTTSFEAELSSKYVGAQFLDNTSNPNRLLPSYHYQNLRFSKDLNSKYWKKCKITCLINNLLDYKYSSNGYTYSYIYGELITENYYYPQAGRNYMMGINFGF
jgi:iron complex outermembrane receptor protein